MRTDVGSLRDRLETYRALLRRDGPVPELERLVALLESEIDEGRDGGSCEPEPRER